jgi:molybdopterin converting factor small subunit
VFRPQRPTRDDPFPLPLIEIELYGIPRQRAGVQRTQVQAVRLGDALARLADQFPAMAADCFTSPGIAAAGRSRRHAVLLRPEFAANISGDRFVRDPETPLSAGDVLLILSADCGG